MMRMLSEMVKITLMDEIMKHFEEIVKLSKKFNTDMDYLTCSYFESTDRPNNCKISAGIGKELHLFHTWNLEAE